MERILVIEDDPSIAQGLYRNLKFEGYSVQVVNDGEEGLTTAVDNTPDLVLLDVMLPTMNGFEVLRELRRLELEIPVIMLTAKGEELDKVRGLDLGADDYLTKPFALGELLARIRAVLRRKQRFEQQHDFVSFGRVEIDFKARRVVVSGEEVTLTAREIDLLKLFVSREGEALDRREIVSKVWGYDYEGTDRTLDNFVSRLRQKFEADPSCPTHFLTVRGIGYRFVVGR